MTFGEGASLKPLPRPSIGPDASSRPSLFVLDPGLPRFAAWLLVYVSILAALATLSPFNFGLRYLHGYQVETTPADVALNLGLLFPAGFLWRLARNGRGHRWCLDAWLLGTAFSLVLEGLQAFLPTRVPSPSDVITNGLGAWAGAFAHARLSPWLDRRVQRQLSLHLPLANILYLIVPLCSLDAFCIGSRLECALVLPLAAFTGAIAAGFYRYRLLAEQRSFAWRYSLAIGCLFALGYLPLCAHDPSVCALLGASALVMTRASLAFRTRLPKGERRFVLVTIRRALPWFALYVLALAGRPWLQMISDGLALSSEGKALNQLRDIAAFTLLGYLIAELYARRPLSARGVIARAIAGASPFALACIALHLEHSGPVHEALALALLIGAAAAGATIHRAQLRLVRSWGQSLPPPSVAPRPR
ncbi:MAG TPA: VanZ family protein [Polyangiales bacterium]|nr:VanZ family protein [Polyangiales bacterium]